MKNFVPACFITSGHSVQKWKGTDMESMRDTKRIMEREIQKGSTPDFTRAGSIFDREKIYHQMLRQEKKIKPAYEGNCYIETAKCYFSLPEEWEKHKMVYLNNDAFGFILSNQYILGLYKYCREARRDIAVEAHEIPENTNTVIQRLINMDDLEVLSHCLLLDDVWLENNLIGAKMYTIFKLGISSQSAAFLL